MTFPSVTQVLGLYRNFSGIRSEVLANAAERGTAAHRICAALVQGLWVPSIPDDCRGYIESFRLWTPYIEETVLVEKELVDDKLGYQGRPDWIGRIRGDKTLTVLDWKTSLAKGRLWQAQLAAYGHLAEVGLDRPIGRLASLRLKSDGKKPILDDYRRDPHDMAAFASALNAYRYFKEG